MNNPNLWRKNAIPQWQSKLHFFNIPITSAINSKDNPLNLINRIAIRQDFVSFKLDIDNSDIEVSVQTYVILSYDCLHVRYLLRNCLLRALRGLKLKFNGARITFVLFVQLIFGYNPQKN